MLLNTIKQARLRRAKATRIKISNSKRFRLLVHKSNNHIYAQILDPSSNNVVVSASTVEAEVKKQYPNGGTVEAARYIGQLVAKKSLDSQISEIAFDRSGFKYHGRIKALADAARSAGMKF
ncbi:MULTISPECIES: 50S ribosomal protein L18 [Nitrosomonas]|uniref:Large ribosomal subunit protein uL18 n=2 Tax=Nitrosomonas eutropha TaxID=916 RepID=A0ABX5M6D3_9PROT|nr:MULTISPECIES: 50S ribosomal protein L18 [Nitrosomonas]ABI58846.1 LSU ribosomal protein L18P [Nitrosomonas eutropha C91]MXS79739.1 50S ribosomal protein L18 [Nitrosomonas sp. GH22]PXV80572.1 LSU ribosomal protein L18P [Nitrosomonas eutropha]SCX04465.1 LSU ribosomal protein L18P [Nitrosomonas eutropha]SDW45387.1 LSU ribosomal protein L18P [Nitrosomonas eutropha]